MITFPWEKKEMDMYWMEFQGTIVFQITEILLCWAVKWKAQLLSSCDLFIFHTGYRNYLVLTALQWGSCLTGTEISLRGLIHCQLWDWKPWLSVLPSHWQQHASLLNLAEWHELGLWKMLLSKNINRILRKISKERKRTKICTWIINN